MGRKKPFIEKGEGVKFFLVHRSQKDPLYLDENLGEHVLVPADPETNRNLVESINGLTLSNKSKKSENRKYPKKREYDTIKSYQFVSHFYLKILFLKDIIIYE